MDCRRDSLPRRDFLKQSGAAGLIAWLHGGCRPNGPDRAASPSAPVPQNDKAVATARIAALHLRSAASIGELRRFYHESIGLPLTAESSSRVEFKAGETTIAFEYVESRADARPFYHFAFNIPENKIRAARDWQAKRCPLIGTPPELRDPRYPDDVRWFRHWNAHSVFFWDPAGNLVEYIARHDLACAADGPFSMTDILYASEIGLVVDDAVRDETARMLASDFGLNGYPRSSSDNFAFGDERGLVLLLANGLRRNFDPQRETIWRIYPTHVELRGKDVRDRGVASYPYQLRSS